MSTDKKDADEKRAQRDWLSFNDLQEMGIVTNWQTMAAWQRDPKIAFPLGRLFGPNSRRWSKQHEIDPWLSSRPIARADLEDDAASVLPSAKPKQNKEDYHVSQ